MLLLLALLFGLFYRMYDTPTPAVVFAILFTLLLFAQYSLPCLACYVPPRCYMYH
jgi:hypothetical protein